MAPNYYSTRLVDDYTTMIYCYSRPVRRALNWFKTQARPDQTRALLNQVRRARGLPGRPTASDALRVPLLHFATQLSELREGAAAVPGALLQ